MAVSWRCWCSGWQTGWQPGDARWGGGNPFGPHGGGFLLLVLRTKGVG